jgi:ABC-2 type transport system ATP-binding protein
MIAYHLIKKWRQRAAERERLMTLASPPAALASLAAAPRARTAVAERPEPAEDTVIAAQGLVKRYGSLVAVDGISFCVQAGEIFGLLGPNGAGKTTTLEMIEGLRTPDAGDAVVLGSSIRRDPRSIKARIGVQLQTTALPPNMTVAEAIDLFGAFYTHRRPTADLLQQFDLAEKADARTESLSGGQVQRLSIALALVNDPEIVFLDEPTTGLDPQARLNLWDVIEGIRARSQTVVLTTHYMEEAERLCDRLAVVDRGHIVAMGTPSDLIAEHAPGATIEFDTPLPDLALFRALDGVERADVESTRVSLRTERPERVLAQLFAADRGLPEIRDLQVHQGRLEDVFIALTGRRLRS